MGRAVLAAVVVRTLDMTAAQGEELLLDIARHLPDGHDLGQPFVVCGDVVGTVTAWYFRDEGGCSTSRVVDIGDGLAELTTWVFGEEVSRFVGDPV